jgi:hypothetical protein
MTQPTLEFLELFFLQAMNIPVKAGWLCNAHPVSWSKPLNFGAR